jgi:hypothetical protein
MSHQLLTACVRGGIQRARRKDSKQLWDGYKEAREDIKDMGVGTEDARGCEDGEDAFKESLPPLWTLHPSL